MSLARRLFLGLALVSCGITAAAAAYPERPIRWVVGYPAGGGSDFIARTVGAALHAGTGQDVIVDNKPGVGANLGADAVAKAAPDGYTIFNGDNGVLVNNKVLYKKLPYSAERDLRPVSLLVRAPLLLVVPATSSATSLQSFIALAKSTPNGLQYASPGNGTPHHLAGEALRLRIGVPMTHVPYRGAAPAVTDLAGGQVQAALLDYAAARAFIDSGKIRALAVAGPTRLSSLPQVPTMSEAGLPGFEAVLFVGVMAPSKTPDDVVQQLSAELAKAVHLPDVSRKLVEAGLEPVGSTPEEFRAVIRDTSATWEPLIQKMGISLD